MAQKNGRGGARRPPPAHALLRRDITRVDPLDEQRADVVGGQSCAQWAATGLHGSRPVRSARTRSIIDGRSPPDRSAWHRPARRSSAAKAPRREAPSYCPPAIVDGHRSRRPRTQSNAGIARIGGILRTRVAVPAILGGRALFPGKTARCRCSGKRGSRSGRCDAEWAAARPGRRDARAARRPSPCAVW